MDNLFLEQAIKLAKSGEYTARPNPIVGCVIVKDGQIIGQGAHWQAGFEHAEVNALNAAKQSGHTVLGATMYVTLEPCFHTGRTDPCVDSIINAKIGEVIVGTKDISSKVNGQSIEKLTNAGIKVTLISGKLAAKCRDLNPGFNKMHTKNMPYVRSKIAISLDGKIAMHDYSSKWITNQASRLDAHLWRAKSHAILTTAKTVLQDDSKLTARNLSFLKDLPKNINFKQPCPVILDSNLSLQSATIFKEHKKIIVFASESLASDKINSFLQRYPNVDLYQIANNNLGKLCLHSVLHKLAKLEYSEILVEAGADLNTSMLEQNFIDELLIYQAPKIMGQNTIGFNNLNINNLVNAKTGKIITTKQLDSDLFIQLKMENEC